MDDYPCGPRSPDCLERCDGPQNDRETIIDVTWKLRKLVPSLDFKPKTQSCQDHARLGFNELYNDTISDVNFILDTLESLLLKEPDMKRNTTFLECLKGAMEVLTLKPLRYGNTGRVIQLLKNSFDNNFDGLNFILGIYHRVLKRRIQRFFLNDALEYLILASIEHDFDLFHCLRSSRSRRWNNGAQTLLFMAALDKSAYVDVLFLLRYGVWPIDMYTVCPVSPDTYLEEYQLTKSCSLLRSLLGHKFYTGMDLMLITKAVMDNVPFPVPNAETLKRHGAKDEEIKKFNFRFPEWAKMSSIAIRELKHLARISIRQRLARCLQLPNGIDKLELQQELKDYLDVLVVEYPDRYTALQKFRPMANM